MSVSRKALCLAALGAAVLALQAGCYSRTQHVAKATPATAKIFVAFEVDPALVKLQTEQMKELANDSKGQGEGNISASQIDQSGEMIKVLGESLLATMKSDLVRNNIGFPVTDPDGEVDLKLIGRFRPDPRSGAALDWELVEARSGAVIHAGVATSMFMNVEQYSDQILADLLKIDVDLYATGAGLRPVAAKPVGAGPLSPVASKTDGRSSFAVIIGIENYRDGLPRASFAEDDAKAFATFAEKTLGVPPEHIRMITGERAGRADIASAVEEWLPRNVREPGSTVYFFFSGHGAPDIETGDAYLVPYDADPAFLKTRGYALSTLYERLGALSDARSFAFIDACFSGVGDRSVLAEGTRPLVPVKEVQTPGGVVAFSAASANEATGAASGGTHGLFTFHLLKAMTGEADRDKDRNVTLDEIVAHVTREVTREARLQNRDQTPALSNPAGLDPNALIMIEALSP